MICELFNGIFGWMYLFILISYFEFILLNKLEFCIVCIKVWMWVGFLCILLGFVILFEIFIVLGVIRESVVVILLGVSLFVNS